MLTYKQRIKFLEKIIEAKDLEIDRLNKTLNVYVLKREDNVGYDEFLEQSIVADSIENALLLANKQYGKWKVIKKVDLTKEQILTKDFNAG